MYRFSKHSRQRLDTCDARLIELCEELIKWVDLTIVCGHRNRKAQMIAYQDGKSTKPWPQSRHNRYPSLAVDLGIYRPEIRNINWESRKDFFLIANLMLAEAFKKKIPIRWGGAWHGYPTRRGFIDMPHFEII